MRLLLVCLPLLCTSAFAEDDNAFGPYATNPGLTSGDVSGFSQLYVEAASLADKLSPANAHAGEPNGELVIENTSTAFAKVTVGDVLVGVLGPLTSGRIQDAKAGSYKVKLELPNGYTKTVVVGTPAVEAPAVEEAPPADAETEAP